MTVSELRDNMFEKVIPEKVMPQNIEAILLSDGEAELPELDAFTFLNRLRSLGIGSADFLYLLKGCGAPEGAISQIEQDPAMNLQSLIVTLDSSGLKSQDYTRMLYTARQLWERTLTMRFDEIQAKRPENTQELVFAGFSEKNDESFPAEYEPAMESSSDNEEAEEYTEQTVLQKYDEAEEEQSFSEEADEAEEQTLSDEYDELEQLVSESEPLNISARVFTETTQFLKAEVTAETGNTDFDEELDFQGENVEEPNEFEERCESEKGGQNEQEEIRHVTDSWHKRALVTAAVGAVCVCAAAVWAEFTDFAAGSWVRFAQNSGEIFAQIFYSYNNGVIGGENVIEYNAASAALFENSPSAELFGATLVESLGGSPAVCSGNMVYFQDENALAVYEKENDKLSACGKIAPPEGSEFIELREENGAVYAVFSGEKSGAMRISESAPVYIAAQDGILTDIAFENGEVKIGTVYVPLFTESFSAEDVSEYLPSVGGALIEASSVLLCGEEGCGYAVAGSYSAEDGALLSAVAVIGDPVFASADGIAGLSTQDGGLVVKPNEQPEIYKIGAISAWAYSDGVFAFAESEKTESLLKEAESADNAESAEDADIGTVRVYLRDESLNALSAFENLSSIPTALRLSDGKLLAEGENGVVLCADCSVPAEPTLMLVNKKSGVIFEDRALCCEKTSAGIKLSLIKSGETLLSFEKTLSENELDTLEFGLAQCSFAFGSQSAGIGYSWFDGVCLVSEYVVFGKNSLLKTLYDDKTGFTAAACVDGEVFLFKGEDAQPA